jgi:putative two-component system response regulator
LPQELGPAPPLVTLADDDAGSRALLRAILEREGCAVRDAADGGSVLRLVSEQRPALVLLDIDMPVANGIEVTRRLRRHYSNAELPIILITGHHETPTKVAALEAGATDFVTKPYEPTELIARVRSSLRTHAAFQHLESAEGVIAALANAVEAKDPTTEQHCSRLAASTVELARGLGIVGEELSAISFGAVLHDIGKIGVPERVITKAAALDATEMAAMRQHPVIGAAIVGPLRMGRLVAPIVRGHHERWDGTGYPDGLAGLAIPVGSRLVAIVDAYDAMTHDRPYRAAMPHDRARAELVRHAGSQFDPELTRRFTEFIENAPTRAAVRAREVGVASDVRDLTRALFGEQLAL